MLNSETLRIATFASRDTVNTPHVYTSSHSYDIGNRLTVQRHPVQLAPSPSQDSVVYAYDTLGQLSTVTDLLGRVFTYHYNTRGDVFRLEMPGNIRDSSAFDGDGRQTRSWLLNGSFSGDKYTDSVLRSTTLALDAQGRVLTAFDSAYAKDSVWADYDGMGQLVHRHRRKPITSNFGTNGTASSDEQFAIDAMGNRFASSTADTSTTSGVTITTSTDEDSWYLAGGRLGRILHTYPTNNYTDSLRYDDDGNLRIQFKWQDDYTRHPSLTDHVNFYGADGRLRAAETRTAVEQTAIDNPWSMTFEEYRYDALGRRVLVRTRYRSSGSEKDRDTTDHAHYFPSEYSVAARGTVRRTVWDGNAELYEIEMPEDILWENDTAVVKETIDGATSLDPNPMYGRVAYTYGSAMAQPLSLTRMNFADTILTGGGAPFLVRAPFTVVPHWDYRGHANTGTGANGEGQFCITTNTRCIYVPWTTQHFAFIQDRDVASSINWFGTLILDKEDATGMEYRRNRYVDPNTGRFTQEDPIGLAGGMNLYGFASGDPVNFADPLGLCDKPGEPPCPSEYQQGQVMLSWMSAITSVLVFNELTRFLEGGSAAGVGGAFEGEAAALSSRSGLALENANYAQRTYSQTFSAGGTFAGKTVSGLAGEIRSGAIAASQVPVEYISRGGNTLILNTRSAQALEQAGIPRAQWTAVNMTGVPAAEARLTAQLRRNALTGSGIAKVTPHD